jgi:hypothetical protein
MMHSFPKGRAAAADLDALLLLEPTGEEGGADENLSARSPMEPNLRLANCREGERARGGGRDGSPAGG